MKKGTGLIAAGLVLIGLGISLVVCNGVQSRRAGRVSAQAAAVLEQAVQQTPQAEPDGQQAAMSQILPDYVREPEAEMPTRQIDGADYIGILEIPQLDLVLPVIDQCTESNLKLAPCRYTGSAYQPDFVICAHNYAAHFGSLSNLGLGDLVTFTDLEGKVFSYTVASVELLAPTAVEEMTKSGWDLTLFTCTVGAQSRLAVRCRLVP